MHELVVHNLYRRLWLPDNLSTYRKISVEFLRNSKEHV